MNQIANIIVEIKGDFHMSISLKRTLNISLAALMFLSVGASASSVNVSAKRVHTHRVIRHHAHKHIRRARRNHMRKHAKRTVRRKRTVKANKPNKDAKKLLHMNNYLEHKIGANTQHLFTVGYKKNGKFHYYKTGFYRDGKGGENWFPYSQTNALLNWAKDMIPPKD